MKLDVRKCCSVMGASALGIMVLLSVPGPTAARTNNNWSSVNRSQQCSREAERYANRHARRRTAATAAGGAAVGGVVGGSGRNAGRGALIGGGAGLFQANSRWRTYYNRAYRRCINR
ncbi:MAG: hypothetical protein U1F47_06120 [Hyphomicrobiales bacterium]|jgi:hypothetical protein